MSLWPQIASESGSAKVACSSERPSGIAEQVLERDLRDRDQLGVGALVVEAHQLAVARTGARCPLRHRRQRPHQRVEMQCTWSPTAMPVGGHLGGRRRADLDQLAADLVAEHPGRRDPAVAVVEGAHVGAADPARRDPQQHAVGRGRRRPPPHPPTSLPGPSQIAARIRTLRSFAHVLAPSRYHSPSCPTTWRSGDRVHLHADAGRPDARGRREPSTPRSPTAASRHVGCKDVGLPRDELAGAHGRHPRQRPHDATSRSCPRRHEATLESARAAAEIGPDFLIGGTLIEPVQEIIAGTGIQLLPLRRPDRRPPLPPARLDRGDRR